MDYKKAFALLGLSTDSSLDDVERAYKIIASEKHPDKGGKDAEMASLTEARDLLREYFSDTNMPAIIKKFEIAVRDMNTIAINQRNIERKVERIADDIRRTATNRLKKWRQIVIVLAAISTAAIFSGKVIPKDLVSSFLPREIPMPDKVAEPIRTDNINKIEAIIYDYNSQENSKNPSRKITEEEKKIIDSYQDKRVKYNEYRYITRHNMRIKEAKRMHVLTWYTTTFGLGISAAILAWYYNRRIQRVELELTEFNEELLTKSAYFELLKNIFSVEIPATWTQKELEVIVSAWQPIKKSWQIIHSAVGAKKFVQLFLVKGQEVGFLKITEGNEQNNYEETYLIAESNKT